MAVRWTDLLSWLTCVSMGWTSGSTGKHFIKKEDLLIMFKCPTVCEVWLLAAYSRHPRFRKVFKTAR